MLNNYFPFDTARISALVAEKTQRTVDEVLTEWRQAASLGTSVHGYIEDLLHGAANPPPREGSPIEARPFYPVAAEAVHAVTAKYDVVAVEAMVCSPKLGIAGTIDFIGRSKETGRLLIVDWKTSGSPSTGFRFSDFEEPCPQPLKHLPNNKYSRYAVQVLTYGYILRGDGYHDIYPGLDQPLDYGLAVFSKLDNGGVGLEFKKVTPESIMPADRGDDLSPDAFLELLVSGR